MKTLHAYILGFILSIGLTLFAFSMVQMHLDSGHVAPSHEVAIPALITLAIAQLLVQLILFLHLGREQKPRWNLIALCFALFVVTVVVGGSLWIMNHLHHESMSDYNVFEEENIMPHDHANAN
ncbi:MAG: cytochrome o ubiquinol oxidase subunit IV [Patescibacteria group bacterium]